MPESRNNIVTNEQVTYIRWERRTVPILKNMKLSGYSKEACEIKFTPQFVNKHWDKL